MLGTQHALGAPAGATRQRGSALPKPAPARHLNQRLVRRAALQEQRLVRRAALQEQQQHVPASLSPSSSSNSEEHEQHVQQIQETFDLNLHHYQPLWLQPQVVVAAGLGFVAAALAVEHEHPLKAIMLAAGPVALLWGIFLYVLPRSFQKFAVGYIEEHPELEEEALLELQQQQEQQQQHEQQQQQEHQQ